MNQRVFWFFVCLLAATSPLPGAESPVTVSVDCNHMIDSPLHLWGCVNVSRRAPPPVELCGRIEREFGRPRITRCWLMLDQMWDYRTDTYRFNYEINKDYYVGDPHKKRYGVAGHTTGLHYYDYVDSVSAHSQFVLMNIRRYEQEVLTGMISFEKWKEVFKAAVRHYKQRCPNLRYIEVLNEPTARNQSNLGKIEHYYGFYRRAYEAINELNAELEPAIPLLVGGSSGFRTAEAKHLIHDFARDENPDKRLDFVSFHHYWVEKTPAEIAGWEDEIDGALAAASLSTELPIFVTEIGYAWKWRTDRQKNLWHAAHDGVSVPRPTRIRPAALPLGSVSFRAADCDGPVRHENADDALRCRREDAADASGPGSPVPFVRPRPTGQRCGRVDDARRQRPDRPDLEPGPATPDPGPRRCLDRQYSRVISRRARYRPPIPDRFNAQQLFCDV